MGYIGKFLKYNFIYRHNNFAYIYIYTTLHTDIAAGPTMRKKPDQNRPVGVSQ